MSQSTAQKWKTSRVLWGVVGVSKYCTEMKNVQGFMGCSGCLKVLHRNKEMSRVLCRCTGCLKVLHWNKETLRVLWGIGGGFKVLHRNKEMSRVLWGCCGHLKVQHRNLKKNVQGLWDVLAGCSGHTLQRLWVNLLFLRKRSTDTRTVGKYCAETKKRPGFVGCSCWV